MLFQSLFIDVSKIALFMNVWLVSYCGLVVLVVAGMQALTFIMRKLQNFHEVDNGDVACDINLISFLCGVFGSAFVFVLVCVSTQHLSVLHYDSIIH